MFEATKTFQQKSFALDFKPLIFNPVSIFLLYNMHIYTITLVSFHSVSCGKPLLIPPPGDASGGRAAARKTYFSPEMSDHSFFQIKMRERQSFSVLLGLWLQHHQQSLLTGDRE